MTSVCGDIPGQSPFKVETQKSLSLSFSLSIYRSPGEEEITARYGERCALNVLKKTMPYGLEKACISKSFKYVFTLEKADYTGHTLPSLVKI